MDEEQESKVASTRIERVRSVDEEQLKLFHEWLRYEDGQLFWRKRPGPAAKMEEPIGCFDTDGYLVFKFQRVTRKVHRVIFFMHHGYWPDVVDHKDRDKENNDVDNLRDATVAQNMWNRDVANVSYATYKPLPNPYRVLIRRNGKIVHLSNHPTYDDALTIADSLKNELGEVNV